MKKSINGISKNDIFECDITDVTNTGAGVARIDGIVAFVSGAIDGERVKAKVIKVANGYLVCRAEEIITASPYRTLPLCPVSKRCGGCVYPHIDYLHELEIKRGYVVSAFRKNGIEANVQPTITAGKESGWRNKIQLPCSADGTVGYYASHSHDIIPCSSCALHVKGADEIIGYAAELVGEMKLPGVRHICLRRGRNKNGEEFLLCFVAEKENRLYHDAAVRIAARFPRVCGVMLNINADDTNVIYGDKFITLCGRDYIEDELLGLTFRVSMPSFYQVNHDAATLAYKKLFELSGVKSGDKVLDLYCGTGTIGLYFASQCPEITLTGIEIIPQAIENAKLNASANRISNASFFCADAGSGITDYSADIIIVDPPRKGLGDDAIDLISDASPRAIAYMSCDPDTLARDAASLLRRGYSIGDIYPVDMFPRTGHVETVVLMSRKL